MGICMFRTAETTDERSEDARSANAYRTRVHVRLHACRGMERQDIDITNPEHSKYTIRGGDISDLGRC